MSYEPPVIHRDPGPGAPSFQGPDYVRRDDERKAWVSTTIALVPAICGGLALIFVFFALMGAIDLGDAVVATVIAVLFAAIWAAAFIYRRRTHADRVQWRDRERRGF